MDWLCTGWVPLLIINRLSTTLTQDWKYMITFCCSKAVIEPFITSFISWARGLVQGLRPIACSWLAHCMQFSTWHHMVPSPLGVSPRTTKHVPSLNKTRTARVFCNGPDTILISSPSKLRSEDGSFPKIQMPYTSKLEDSDYRNSSDLYCLPASLDWRCYPITLLWDFKGI